MTEREILLQHISDSANVIDEIAKKEDKYYHNDELADKFKHKSSMKKLIIGSIICLIAAAWLGSGIGGIVPFIPLLIFLGVWGIYKYSSISYRAKANAYSKEIQQLQADSSLSWLPPAYRTSYCYGKISEYLQNMRAETLKEALNLLETEMHQDRVELYTALNRN